MRPHTVDEAAAVVDVVEDWQDEFRSRARPPPRVRGRRVLPAGRPRLPARRRPTRASRCTRTASAWRARSSSSSRRGPTTATAPGRGLLRVGRGHGRDRPRLRALPRAARRRRTCTIKPSRSRARWRVLTRRVRRAGARAAAGDGSTATTCASLPVENRFFGGTTAVTGLMVGEDIARVLAAEPEGHRYLLPDVCLSGGRFLDGTTPATCPARSRSSPPTAAPCARCTGRTP